MTDPTDLRGTEHSLGADDVRVPEELPDDVAAWIDEHDPVLPGLDVPAADEDDTPRGDPDLRDAAAGDAAAGDSGTGDAAAGDAAAGDAAAGDSEIGDGAAVALEEQRARHEPAVREANEAVGTLVNNTGDDGGAASG